jgi:hypothetical protein
MAINVLIVREPARFSFKIEYETIKVKIPTNYDTASPKTLICRLAKGAITPKDAPEVGVIA